MEALSMDSKTAERLTTLLDLLRNPDVMKKAQDMMEKEKKESQKVKHTVKRYKTVILNTSCTHCGFTFRRLIKLETKGDSFVYNMYGQVHVVYYKDVLDMMMVYATTRKCENCGKFIATLSREELERRYLNILNREEVTAKHPPGKPVQKEKITELFMDLEDGIIQENQAVPEFTQEVVEIESEEVTDYGD